MLLRLRPKRRANPPYELLCLKLSFYLDDIDYFPNDEEKYKYSAKIARQIEDEEQKDNGLLIRNSFLKDTLN